MRQPPFSTPPASQQMGLWVSRALLGPPYAQIRAALFTLIRSHARPTLAQTRSVSERDFIQAYYSEVLLGRLRRRMAERS